MTNLRSFRIGVLFIKNDFLKHYSEIVDIFVDLNYLTGYIFRLTQKNMPTWKVYGAKWTPIYKIYNFL